MKFNDGLRYLAGTGLCGLFAFAVVYEPKFSVNKEKMTVTETMHDGPLTVVDSTADFKNDKVYIHHHPTNSEGDMTPVGKFDTIPMAEAKPAFVNKCKKKLGI